MRWPWSKREKREASYGDEVLALLLQRAGASTFADTLQTLALEAAAGAVGRAFAAVELEGPLAPELEPHLEHIGRSFIRRGESILVPSARGFERGAAWDVEGGDRWRYKVSLARPDETVTVSLDESRILHFRAAESRSAPYKGRSPLAVGDKGGRLLVKLEHALADEAGHPVGSVLPVPVNPSGGKLDDIQTDIRELAGRVMLVESQRDGWGLGEHAGAPAGVEWEAKRLGANPPDGLVSLMVEHRRLVLAACGVPPEILGGSDGAARREAWRLFAHGTLGPLGRIVEREVTAKFGPVRFNWGALRAGDVSGRARAYKALIEGGMDAPKAEKLAGFAAE